MADVVDNHCIRRDFIHDQIFPNRKSQEAGLPCRSTDMRRSGNARSRTFNSSDETACSLPIVRSYAPKDLSEIGKCYGGVAAGCGAHASSRSALSAALNRREAAMS